MATWQAPVVEEIEIFHIIQIQEARQSVSSVEATPVGAPLRPWMAPLPTGGAGTSKGKKSTPPTHAPWSSQLMRDEQRNDI